MNFLEEAKYYKTSVECQLYICQVIVLYCVTQTFEIFFIDSKSFSFFFLITWQMLL